MSEIKELDEQLGGTITRAGSFYEKNKKTIIIVGAAVVAILLGFFGFKYMKQSKEAEASTKLFLIEDYFAQDSSDLVLNGDPKNPDSQGAIAFIDEYSGTPSAQKAAYMAGCAYMKKGDFTAAIDMLKQYKLDDELVQARAYGLIGDCNVELGNNEEAESYYKKAVNHSNNQFTAPIYLKKLGLVQEALGKNKEALASYKRIKKEYAEVEVAREIEKYIARAAAKAGEIDFNN